MYHWLPINSKDDLSKLSEFGYITSEYDPVNVADKLSDGISSAVKSILIEKNYIDKDYRSTYYNFYSKKGHFYRSDCVRLHFFDETVQFDPTRLTLTCKDNDLSDHYFGYMVLRPTGIGTIGRSVVSPDVRTGSSGLTISAKHKTHVLGYTLEVEGFPSMDQHLDISVCAHAACRSILRHYSNKFKSYRQFLTQDITMMAQSFDPGGIIPSQGLDVSNAERVFQQAGTFPVLISKIDGNDALFYRQLISYVESELPLFAAMWSIGHAIVVIGHEWDHSKKLENGKDEHYSWDQVKSLVVIDDNHLPYLTVEHGGGKDYKIEDIDAFIVALPEKVFYPAEAVDELAQNLFYLRNLIKLPPKDETIIRYFLTTGSKLRRFIRRVQSEFDPELLKSVMGLPLTQFIWVIEFATENEWETGQISARAIVDGTAGLRENYPLWFFHNRETALVFDRVKIDRSNPGISQFSLTGMANTALTRMNQNLRPTKSK